MAFPDRHKVVLVERNRLEATVACIDEVKKLRIRELVLYFDWRVLEDWMHVERDGISQILEGALRAKRRKVLEERYFGFTCWSTERDEMVFLHRDLAKMPRKWLDFEG